MGKRRQRALPKEVLWALKNGDDRAGRERTWREVATVLDLSVAYVRGSASGTYKMPLEIPVYDPRDVLPQLREVMSDEDVAVWQENPLCLCGCGGETARESARTGLAPHGGFRMFVGSHSKRMPWVKAHLAAYNQDPARRRKTRDTKKAQCIDASLLAGELREWKAMTGETYKDLAARVHINEKHISSILCGRIPRVSRLTAAKLLIGMGQPVRPEIAAAYRAWAQRWQLTMPDVKVES